MAKALLVLALAMLAVAPPALAQAPKPYHPPLAADGHPDFEGVWANPPRGAMLEKGAFGAALTVSAAQAEAMTKAYNAEVRARPVFLTQADLPEFAFGKVRGELRTRLLVEPADGLLPYTPTARKAVDGWYAEYLIYRGGGPLDHPEHADLSLRCITAEGQPPMRVAADHALRQIVQTPGSIAIYSEYMNELRIVRMGGGFAPPAVRSLLGDSVGRWEGQVLVVETRNFRLDNPFHMVIGEKPVMVGPDSVMEERFRRVSDSELDYSFTVKDPTIYARPWLAEYAFSRSNARPYETACHEGNYGMEFILAGSRQAEDASKTVAGR